MTGKSDNAITITREMAEKVVAEITPEFLAAFDAMTDEDIAEQIASNPDAAPELTDEWFGNARLVRPLRKPKAA